VRWPSGLRRQLKVIPFVVHQYNRWSERAWVQIPLSSTYLLPIIPSTGRQTSLSFELRDAWMFGFAVDIQMVTGGGSYLDRGLLMKHV
jgi:hypothetical protein